MRSALVLVLLLAVPATALAGDASLRKTWKRFDAHPEGLAELLSTSGDAARKNQLRLKRGYTALERITERTRQALAGDAPSTRAGAVARRRAVACLLATRFATRRFLAAIELVLEGGQPPAGSAEERRLARLLGPAFKKSKKAIRLQAEASERFAGL